MRSLQREYVKVWVDALIARRPDLTPTTARARVQAVLGLINSTPLIRRTPTTEIVLLLRTMAAAAIDAA